MFCFVFNIFVSLFYLFIEFFLYHLILFYHVTTFFFFFFPQFFNSPHWLPSSLVNYLTHHNIIFQIKWFYFFLPYLAMDFLTLSPLSFFVCLPPSLFSFSLLLSLSLYLSHSLYLSLNLSLHPSHTHTLIHNSPPSLLIPSFLYSPLYYHHFFYFRSFRCWRVFRIRFPA